MSYSQNNLPIEQEMSVANNHDIHGNPTNGIAEGVGINIQFRSEEEINTPTGCTLLDVIKVARLRVNWIQHFKPPAGEISSKCKEYADALSYLNKAMAAIRKREDRVAQERAGETQTQ
jgi:hypothetical protein